MYFDSHFPNYYLKCISCGRAAVGTKSLSLTDGDCVVDTRDAWKKSNRKRGVLIIIILNYDTLL